MDEEVQPLAQIDNAEPLANRQKCSRNARRERSDGSETSELHSNYLADVHRGQVCIEKRATSSLKLSSEFSLLCFHLSPVQQ
jgi:hypothetical protein